MTIASERPAEAAWLHHARRHWRIYLTEAALLGIFMVCACGFAVLLEHPDSPARRAIASALSRRALMGLAMGATAATLIYSRAGRRSGALMNPATTLSFLRLGRIHPVDAALYIIAQCVGGASGVGIAALLLREQLMHPQVSYVATVPGRYGVPAAWAAEFGMAFVMLTTVLTVNRLPRLAPFTGLFAAALVSLYITVESPISGMSLNPARTLASAVNGHIWSALWVYFTAPVAGMLVAVEINRLLSAAPEKLCGKFSHSSAVECIFKCNCAKRARSRSSGT